MIAVNRSPTFKCFPIYALSPGIDDQLQQVHDLYVGDLLSHVLKQAKPHQVWLTVQSHPTIVAVASLKNLRAIIVVDGVEVPAETIEAASQNGVHLFSSPLSAVELIKLFTMRDSQRY